jgi:hypothetical protein
MFVFLDPVFVKRRVGGKACLAKGKRLAGLGPNMLRQERRRKSNSTTQVLKDVFNYILIGDRPTS